MARCRSLVFSLALVALAIFGATGDGQEKKGQNQPFEPASGPGEGQKFLGRMAGDWEIKKTIFPRAMGAAPIRSVGTCKQYMIQDNRFLQSDFTFQGKEGTTTGTGVIGFEPANGLFTSTWYDSRQTKMSIRRSKNKFDGEKIELFAADLGEKADARKSRTLSTIEEEGNLLRHRQYSIAADGSERLVMELEMRKKGAK